MKLKESVENGKQEPRDHRQTRHNPNSHALFANYCLELKLAYTAIKEHTITLHIQELRWSFSELRDEKSRVETPQGVHNCLLFWMSFKFLLFE